MEKFCGNVLQGEYGILTNLLACYFIGDGAIATNCDDNLLFGHFLEGKTPNIRIQHTHVCTCLFDNLRVCVCVCGTYAKS